MGRAERYLFERELVASLIGNDGEEHSLRSAARFPQYDEIATADDLRSSTRVAQSMESVDWSFTNEDTQFLAHDLHPYPAKFIPQIPGHCIARLSLPGELVFDPFGGSGTTALEAVRMGRRALSMDANPVATLIGRVKTGNLDRAAAREVRTVRSALVTLLADLPPPGVLCKEYASHIPEIPNVAKWFPTTSQGELAAIRSRISTLKRSTARDIASVALSRIVITVSFQDSETRYASKPRNIPPRETIRRFLSALDATVRTLTQTQPVVRYGVSKFLTADTRTLRDAPMDPESVDLVVTSPPYGNANDYHLYHRFRLLWLGHDPRRLGRIEIGSHLRHQRESNGFDAYTEEVAQSLDGVHRLLKTGRYAVLVVGDPVYDGVRHAAARVLSEVAERQGFETICILQRALHQTRRSFLPAGRRATNEHLVVLRKPPRRVSIWLTPPRYRLWPYEKELRSREIEALVGVRPTKEVEGSAELVMDPYSVPETRTLTFTHGVARGVTAPEPTWQAILENSLVARSGSRKDPKYVTHGLHRYKGKFYPQLAKALMNLAGLPPASRVLDPFCGSGTTLLEGFLNGHLAFGCDMNPMAAKIARAKVGILEISPNIVREAFGAVASQVEDAPSPLEDPELQFNPTCLNEIQQWFPSPVVRKLAWLLSVIRTASNGVVRDLLEVILSDLARQVSQQDPKDLRIRRRRVPIEDADVFGLYLGALEAQFDRLEQFWKARSYSPRRLLSAMVVEGDSRNEATFDLMGIPPESVDLVLTSPPYATALPYIDTDRLSLLLLFGMNSAARRPLEHNLTGSREITTSARRALETGIGDDAVRLPAPVCDYLKDLKERIDEAKLGFRRRNMPALLARFFLDMVDVIQNCHRRLRSGGEAMIIIGDNRVRVGPEFERIPTTDFVRDIALASGMSLIESLDISVTTENLVHSKHAITKNVVLRLHA